jgi:hypothetical protein
MKNRADLWMMAFWAVMICLVGLALFDCRPGRADYAPIATASVAACIDLARAYNRPDIELACLQTQTLLPIVEQLLSEASQPNDGGPDHVSTQGTAD